MNVRSPNMPDDDRRPAEAAPSARGTNVKLLLGLIGSGIQRSLTPAMHEAEAAHHGLRLHYQLIDLDLDLDLDLGGKGAVGEGAAQLPGLLQAARTMGFAGLNITYPCKQAVIPLLDELSDEARAMGAVNTVVIRDRRLIGHNTDGSGWRWGFTRALPGADLARVVLLGAGGAGAAIASAVLGLGAGRDRAGGHHLTIVDRDAARARGLAAELAARFGAGRVAASTDIATALHGATGLIHATPTGMDKQPGLPLPAALLTPRLWVAEVVYFPLETALLRAARERGCATVDGGTMAVGQAVDAFRLFTGRDADAGRVEQHFRRLLAERAAAA